MKLSESSLHDSFRYHALFHWLLDRTKGCLVNLAAATAAIESTTLLQHSVSRERSNGANDHSFPSGHSAASSVYTRLAALNLEEIPGRSRLQRPRTLRRVTSLLLTRSYFCAS